MDPIATAFTAAWLDAVRRVQSERIQRLEEIMPDTGADRARSLTDLIEGGLKSGGAEPLSTGSQTENDRQDERPPVHLVDLLV